MDSIIFHAVCQAYQLGELRAAPLEAMGGKRHRLWLLQTLKGLFALKRLSQASLHRGDYRLRYRTTQMISEAFLKRGIPTATALSQGDSLFFESGKEVFMVYPWFGPVNPKQKAISIAQCNIVGRLLGEMHHSHIKLRVSSPWVFDFDSTQWERLLTQAQGKAASFALQFAHQLPDIHSVCREYEKSHIQVNQQRVIAHRDLDISNVVWLDPKSPVIIDWDAAGEIDPGVDLLLTALAWCFESEGRLSFPKFEAVLEAYFAINPMGFAPFKVLFYQVLGNWLNWLRRELRIALNKQGDLAAQQLAKQEVITTLDAFRMVMRERDRFQSIWENSVCKA